MSLLRHTLRAVLTPRRLIPILVVSAPLVGAQHSLSRDPLAMPLGVALSLAFALLAPWLWRLLAPRGLAGLLAYGASGILVRTVWAESSALPKASRLCSRLSPAHG